MRFDTLSTFRTIHRYTQGVALCSLLALMGCRSFGVTTDDPAQEHKQEDVTLQSRASSSQERDYKRCLRLIKDFCDAIEKGVDITLPQYTKHLDAAPQLCRTQLSDIFNSDYSGPKTLSECYLHVLDRMDFL